jgi:hemerythrin-like domain-containing protein
MLDGGHRDPLWSIDEQHGQMAEWAAQVRAAAAFVPGQLDLERVARLRRFYQGTVLGHFRFEERVLFPALRSELDDPALAEELAAFAREHEELRLRLAILLDDLETLAQPGRSFALEAEVVRRAQLTIERLKEHAAAEDVLLAPLLERHGAAVRERLRRLRGGSRGLA